MDGDLDGSDDSGSEHVQEGLLNGSRDHYAQVDQSKLRRPKAAALGPQYRGARIGRKAFSGDVDEDDPFSRDFGDESSNGDVEPRMARSTSLSSNEDSDGSEVLRDDTQDGTDTEPSDLEVETHPGPARSTLSKADRSELMQSLAQDQKAVAGRLAESNKADAEKGRAVKGQRAGFDRLLAVRIKLQKALIGANTVVGTLESDQIRDLAQHKLVIEQAERAAFELWSSVTNLRDELNAQKTGQKRKRAPNTLASSIDSMWQHTQQQEEANVPHRNAILQRWSAKARSTTVQAQHSLINKSERQATIIDALQEHISNPERLLKRVHTPRSCAPLQLAANVAEDDKIYDDADFYGLLLKELVEQKDEGLANTANIDLSFNTQRENRTKKNVDTKASKGRKLRYMVHEKLQNYMAPEDRETWSERQAEELFGSLFGKAMGIGEELVDEGGMRERVSDGEEGGLKLFRS